MYFTAVETGRCTKTVASSKVWFGLKIKNKKGRDTSAACCYYKHHFQAIQSLSQHQKFSVKFHLGKLSYAENLNPEIVVNTVLQWLSYKIQGQVQFWLIQFEKFVQFTSELPLCAAKPSSLRHAGGCHQMRAHSVRCKSSAPMGCQPAGMQHLALTARKNIPRKPEQVMLAVVMPRFVILTDRLSYYYKWIRKKKRGFPSTHPPFFQILEKDQRRKNKKEKLPANLSAVRGEKPHTKPRNKWITGERRIPPSFIRLF